MDNDVPPGAGRRYDPWVSLALFRGLDVLELLGRRSEVKLAEVVSELGMSRATIYRKIHEYGIVAPAK